MTIKLYAPKASEVEQLPKPGAPPTPWEPPEARKPFADSELDFRVVTPYLPATAGYPFTNGGGYTADPRPVPAEAPSAMSEDPKGFDSRWSDTESATPFKLGKR